MDLPEKLRTYLNRAQMALCKKGVDCKDIDPINALVLLNSLDNGPLRMVLDALPKASLRALRETDASIKRRVQSVRPSEDGQKIVTREIFSALDAVASRMQGAETLHVEFKGKDEEAHAMYVGGQWFTGTKKSKTRDPVAFQMNPDLMSFVRLAVDTGKAHRIHVSLEAPRTDQSEERILEAVSVSLETFMVNLKTTFEPTDKRRTRYVSEFPVRMSLTFHVFFNKDDTLDFMESFIYDIEPSSV